LSIAITIVLFTGYALVLGRGAAWLDGSALRGLTSIQRASEIDTMRGYLIQVGAGVLAAGALLYTALNFQLSREGHVTDRYTKAIEQLGSERLDVRLGAIYALERIVIDSARDHPTIVEVLAAFVREHAPAVAPGPKRRRWSWTSLTSRARGGRFLEQDPILATDVQAAVTVLGRRPTGRSERGPVNLASLDLAGADLNGANLTGAILDRSNLSQAELNRAKLTGAWLQFVNLGSAYLNNADLTGAYLNAADLTGATLDSAKLTGADLTGANLTEAYLFDADLTGATLKNAKLTGARLDDADLLGADLTAVTLTDKQRCEVRALPRGGS
jgi:hypothetical protein